MSKFNVYFQDNCESEHTNTVTYIEAFGFLQTVAFTVGYGHISPACHGGKVYNTIITFYIKLQD